MAGGFLVSQGGVALTDTLFNEEGGIFTITAINDFHLEGSFSGLQTAQFSPNPESPTAIEPPVGFSGSFQASFCPGI